MRGWIMALAGFIALSAPALAQGGTLVRVGVVEAAPSATLAMSVPCALFEGDRPRLHLEALATVCLEASGSALVFRSGDATPEIAVGPLRLLPEAPEPAATSRVGSRRYRGILEVRPQLGSLTVVNEVELEDYLYGVVPAESIPSWPLESLKAQAVAARTYAIAHRGQFASLGYDLKASVASQVYGGMAVEKPSTDRAVDETRGQILTYQGKVIDAFYSDCTGGYTESCSGVWGQDLPYLRAVPDFDQQSPRYTWEARFTPDQVKAALGKIPGTIGDLVSLEATERSYTGRVRRARLAGTQGEVVVPGEKLRFAFGLRSTFFNAVRQEDGSWIFAGRGWGHGVGMSQWGTKGLADMGYTFDQILAHYYPGTQLADGDPRLSSPTASR